MRRVRRHLASLLTAVLLANISHAWAGQKPPDIFPLSQVRTGQKGYGLTVFQGTKPERFEFEVLGVGKNMLPKMDIILIKSDDPRILEYGFARGMSGSPLFLDGKIACAFSYGFPFSKGNIGGCTPIEIMLADARRKRPQTAPPAPLPMHQVKEWQTTVLDPLYQAPQAQTLTEYGRMLWPLRSSVDSFGEFQGLMRAALPVSVSGLAPEVMTQAQTLFRSYGLEFFAGSGSATVAPMESAEYLVGGAMGAELARGDVSMIATGTVTYVDGTNVLAFGHPFFQYGALSVPAVTALVHAIVPSVQMPFKLASARHSLGALVQDHKSGVVIDTQKKAAMVPFEIHVKTPLEEQTFRTEVVSHRFLMPPLVSVLATQASQTLAPDMTDMTATIHSALHLRGYPPVEFTDYRYAPDGLANTLTTVRGLRTLLPLLFNPFGTVDIEKITISVDMTHRADVAELQSIRLPQVELKVGTETKLDVVLRPFGGSTYVERVPLVIPEHLAGSTIKIEVASGEQVRPDVAPPESLDDLVDFLRKSYPANTLVVTVYTPHDGILLAGKVIPELPDSALDTVRLATSSRRGDTYKVAHRVVMPTSKVVQGQKELIVKVAEHKVN